MNALISAGLPLLRPDQAVVLIRSNFPPEGICHANHKRLRSFCASHLHKRRGEEEKHRRTGISKARARICAANNKRSSARGIARFLLLGTGYVLVFLATAAMPGLGLMLIGSCGLFLLTFNLAAVGHDAGHGNLTRCSTWNRWIGRAAFLASYVPFSGWLRRP